MNKYYEPTIDGEKGEMNFVLNDGTKTKTFYNVGEFSEDLGVYPILNDKEEIVEYMDLLGNFTNNTTNLARCFYQYCTSIADVPAIRMGRYNLFYTGLSEFPSKYLLDEKVRKIIQAEEKRRFKLACKCHKFNSLIEMVRYKIYISKYMKLKLKRAKEFNQNELNCNTINGENVENETNF